MTIGTTNNAVRYAATFLYATGAYSVGSPILGWVSDTLSQTPEKKAVAYSLVNVTANLAYIYCAYLWPTSDGPRYMIGFSCMIGFCRCKHHMCVGDEVLADEHQQEAQGE